MLCLPIAQCMSWCNTRIMSTALHESAPEFDLADRLRKALRHSGISVQDMAAYLDVSRNTIGRYVNGHTVPDRRTMLLWAMRTGVAVEWLERGDIPAPVGPGSGTKPTDYGHDHQRITLLKAS